MPAAAGAVLTWFLVQYLTGRGLFAVCLGLGIFLVPAWLQEWRETSRLLRLSEQLGRVMGMIGVALRRGTPLEAAIAEGAVAVTTPLGPILKNLADATILGVTLSQAIEQLRIHPTVRGSTDFQVFATEMVICHERGANVVQAFEALRAVLNARRRYRNQVKEQMGQHLIQSLVIAAVGAFVLLAYATMTEQGLDPLLDAAVGQLLLAVSILGNLALIRMTHLSLLRQVRKV
jgi:Flp pilus assembly protein TadB